MSGIVQGNLLGEMNLGHSKIGTGSSVINKNKKVIMQKSHENRNIQM